ncbi:MAG: GNAT family N-acetyltransferase [Flavobacterium sp.]
MGNFLINKVKLDQITQLQKIGKQTFRETFSDYNSDENICQYLEVGFALEKLTEELRNKDAEFYFATHEHEIIGYLKVNFGDAQTELKENNALEIERIYVVNTFHGKGVGQLLYDKAITIAKEKGVEYIWLGVWEENARAIRFYTKNGFVPFDKHIFKLGDDEQTDIMMKLKCSDV